MTGKSSKKELSEKVGGCRELSDLRLRLKKASELLADYVASNFDDSIVCAKSVEVAAKLLSQCCIIGLRMENGWSNSRIAEEITKKGPHASPDMVGSWLAGKTTPKPDRLAALDELYRETAGFQRGRAVSARFQAGN